MASSTELGDHDHDDYLIKRVSITETVLVSSASALQQPPKVVNLSNLDRQCPLFMYSVFFYKCPTTSSSDRSRLWSLDSVFQSLKSGLEETLSIWYPAASRLILTSSTDDDDVNLQSNDVDPGGLNLLCNNKGAMLAKAATVVQISELGDLSQYNKFFENLVYKPPLPLFDDQHVDHFSQMPLVAAQVTEFRCGGYSIGIGISHSLFDGPAAYEFMCAWASNSAIKPNQNKLDVVIDDELQPKPVVLMHDRDTLLRMVDNYSCHDDDEDISCRASAIDHLYQLMMQSAAAVASTDPLMVKSTSSNGDTNYVHKTFHLSSVFINCLKKQAVGDNFICSSFELVASHLWKAKTLALGLSKETMKETMVCLQFSVDARNKVDPPLAQGFTGNAYVLASVALTASQVVDQSDHKAIVDKIREAKKSVTNKYVKSYMKAVAGGGSQETSLPPLKELTLVSDWTRMPFHKVGFLQEEADYASPLIAPVPEVIYFMQNPKDDKGIDMRIGLLPQYLDAFTRYFFANTS
ncbi:brassinosteroid-related acyltransferase 1 [Argentina anserina]|uniref:brassinosteroid-related acyltransferase 1 n=1 Tax=Argentina anserina TaxID=57926 RepID=UPI002176629F|nr:brassinosteroid-related acyltransferase 1 [Potentilla anserina]